MIDIIAFGIILLVFGLAMGYIIKNRKSGIKCLGCPNAKSCCSCKDK